MKLRRANPVEADELSQIAHAAKAHWGYDPALLKNWESELTYTPDYIERHWVTVAEDDAADSKGPGLLGVCSLEPFGDQFEIAGMWVRPEAMGRRVGRALLDAALAHCKSCGVSTLRLLSDPNAQGFYAAMGAVLIGHERGSPNGRLLPLMHISV